MPRAVSFRDSVRGLSALQFPPVPKQKLAVSEKDFKCAPRPLSRTKKKEFGACSSLRSGRVLRGSAACRPWRCGPTAVLACGSAACRPWRCGPTAVLACGSAACRPWRCGPTAVLACGSAACRPWRCGPTAVLACGSAACRPWRCGPTAVLACGSAACRPWRCGPTAVLACGSAACRPWRCGPTAVLACGSALSRFRPRVPLGPLRAAPPPHAEDSVRLVSFYIPPALSPSP